MTRRQCIGAALGAAAGSSCAPVPQSGPDKITGLEILTVQVNSRPWVTFRVRTGRGLSGLGDATHSARESALAASVARKLFEDIRGGGPFEIEPLRQAALPLMSRPNRNVPLVLLFVSLSESIVVGAVGMWESL